MTQDLITYLSALVLEKRKKVLEKVLSNRTRHITVVLEDIYQSQNASAVLRTCDCFGIQDVHIIENTNPYTLNPDVTLGASKWLTIERYNHQHTENTVKAIEKLKSEGYRIVATSPYKKDTDLRDFDISDPIALVFGTELTGVSDTVKEHADEFLRIPMYGFTESFNISVSAAIILHHLSQKLRDSTIEWELTEEERNRLLVNWLEKTIKHGEKVIEQYRKKGQN